MGVSVKVDLSGVKQKFSESNIQRGQYAMGNQMLSDMNPFVPKREGILRSTGHLSYDASLLIWDGPYARRHFFAPGGWKYTTPGTGPRWDLRAQGMFMSDWVKAFSRGAGF